MKKLIVIIPAIAFAMLCHGEGTNDVASLVKRIEALEAKVKELTEYQENRIAKIAEARKKRQEEKKNDPVRKVGEFKAFNLKGEKRIDPKKGAK